MAQAGILTENYSGHSFCIRVATTVPRLVCKVRSFYHWADDRLVVPHTEQVEMMTLSVLVKVYDSVQIVMHSAGNKSEESASSLLLRNPSPPLSQGVGDSPSESQCSKHHASGSRHSTGGSIRESTYNDAGLPIVFPANGYEKCVILLLAVFF